MNKDGIDNIRKSKSGYRQRPRDGHKINLLGFYIAIEATTYVCFLYLDITSKNISISNAMKYSSILICFFFVILPYKKAYEPKNTKKYDKLDINLLRLALLCTFIADCFLLYTRSYIVGLIFFIGVQLFYLLRIYRWRYHHSKSKENKPPIYLYLIRNILITLIIIMILLPLVKINIKPASLIQMNSLKNINQPLAIIIALALFYFISLILNLIDSVIVARRRQTIQAKVFSLGLLLFVLCDINVGISNLFKMFEISSPICIRIRTLSTIGMWFFYLPSQLLISISKYSIKS